ncbi:cytochrome b [Sphingorhabdus buctiana]|jgi:cytochrome b561|uniref:Cytochrome b n=1 Tax=Sphingorhabdus buctiana TaxID=1508805 RepID=A0ABW4MFB3_9SPHN
MISKYSKGAIALHWLIAILVIANFVLASMAEDLPREAQGALMSPHKAIGISILFFSVLRLVWRLTNKPPMLPEAIPAWQSTLGRIVHLLFYFLIIAVPFSGWLMASAHPQAPPVDFFGLFDATLPVDKSKALADVGHEAHEILTKPLFILILLHIIAALKHQFADKLPFVQRMWP